MTTQEFSDQFDVLLNSSFIENDFGEQSSKIDIQLDEYEKSVFLTQAQEQLVINLYNGRNIEGLSFESAEESRRYLKELTIRKEYEYPEVAKDDDSLGYPHCYRLIKNGVEENTPEDCLFITKETAMLQDSNLPQWATDYEDDGTTTKRLIAEVVPITQDEYHRIKRNPYKTFDEFRVLRIEDNNSIRLFSKYTIHDYFMDYIRKPKPIIISAIGNLSIDYYRNESDLYKSGNDYYPDSSHTEPSDIITNHTNGECELNPILHRTILLEAVKLAKIVKQNQIKNEMLGNMPGQLVHPPMQPVNQRPN